MWFGYDMTDFSAKIVFICLKASSISGFQHNVFLPGLSERGVSKCAHLGLIRWRALTAPRKPRISLRLQGGFCSIMAEISFSKAWYQSELTNTHANQFLLLPTHIWGGWHWSHLLSIENTLYHARITSLPRLFHRYKCCQDVLQHHQVFLGPLV